jgi:hypothetical protein
MKKIILTLFFLSFVSLSIHAQDTFFSDSLRKELKQYLVDKDVAWDQNSYNSGMLNIRNEIRKENIDTNPKYKDYKYGIYSFWGDMTPIFSEILIRRGNKYEILGMLSGKSLMEIMTELIAYFYRYPEVPKQLFPLYVDAVSRVYRINSHWEGAFNVKKKRDISEYGKELSNDTIYRLIEDSEGQIEFYID